MSACEALIGRICNACLCNAEVPGWVSNCRIYLDPPPTQRNPCLDCGSPDLDTFARWTWWDGKRKRAVEPLCEPCFRMREKGSR